MLSNSFVVLSVLICFKLAGNVQGKTLQAATDGETTSAENEEILFSGYRYDDAADGFRAKDQTIKNGKKSSAAKQHDGSTWNTNANRRRRSLQDDDDINNNDKFADKEKRIYSDYGYGSRLQAGENMARDYASRRLYGITGPGKRAEDINYEMLSEDLVDKRIPSDYGYGSRLQAAENVAMNWDRNGLFGIAGPGKRTAVYRRMLPDFGYGSRSQAAANAAFSSSHGDLYGRLGPGKRSFAFHGAEMIPEDEINKRLPVDVGYGSRIRAGGNLAHNSVGRGLFHLYGPGKRDSDDNMEADKRIMADFGYGSREQAAENLAKSSDLDRVFGIFGPGKRSDPDADDFDREGRSNENLATDSGYGSRIDAGSQVARDAVAIADVFGLIGPGRR